MSRLPLIARTVPRLGLRNVARVALYKLRLKLGWRPRPLPYDCPGGAVFDMVPAREANTGVASPAALSLFGWHPVSLAAPPDWHADPFGRAPRMDPDQDWVQALAAVGDGDVKPYWELSRFYWLPQFALAARNGDSAAAARIEHWLQDWIARNPPFRGINWACGQEAAIRLMNLTLSALILDCWRNPSPAMKWLVETHARRICPTLSYALGQDNNHGTAEACALFIAGSWGQGWAMPGAARIARIGRKWVNNRALRMIQPDGSPCQYSTTYHRANLEGFCMAGLWSAATGTTGLYAAAAARVAQGARWLHAITDPDHGDAPNLGSNDSSHLFSVPHTPYRDFRPTVALAAALFAGERPWPGYADARLDVLGLQPRGATWPPAASRSSDQGGFHILRQGCATVLMHYPRFCFRPCQADLLHVDLWIGGDNLLRDAGTFSYNMQGAEWFSGTSAHNTVTFDGRDQMPRLGRFLFGDWLRAEDVVSVQTGADGVCAAAGYTDRQGARHHRHVLLNQEALICTDTISGSFTNACLRWRLVPREWTLVGQQIRAGGTVISLNSDSGPLDLTLTKAPESRYYQHQEDIPVLEIGIDRPCTIVTKVEF